MKAILQDIIVWGEKYFDGGHLGEMYLCSILILMIIAKGKKEKFASICTYSILASGLIVCPPIAFVLQKIALSDVYWRMFWVVLIPLVISLAFTYVVVEMETFWKKSCCFTIVVLVLYFGGSNIFNNENYTKSDNLYKIPQSVIDVNNVLCDSNESYIKIIAPDEIVLWIRIYNADIKLLYGRDFLYGYIDGPDEIYDSVNSDIWDVPMMVEHAIFNDCNYIVQPINKALTGDFSTYGFEKIGETREYIVYKDMMKR